MLLYIDFFWNKTRPVSPGSAPDHPNWNRRCYAEDFGGRKPHKVLQRHALRAAPACDALQAHPDGQHELL